MLRLRLNGPVILAAICMMVFALPSKANSPAADADAPVIAIWRTHNLSFDYQSNSVRYSCASLGAKIGAILRAVGAHESLLVQMQCSLGPISGNARAQIVVTTPVEASEENVRAATTYDERDRLVARVRNVDLPSANDIHRFPATWRRIALSRDRQLRLDSSDCELIRGLREQVFPKLSIRVTNNSVYCSPGAATRLKPKFEVAALVPIEAIAVAYAPR